jgi:hypothetical protein
MYIVLKLELNTSHCEVALSGGRQTLIGTCVEVSSGSTSFMIAKSNFTEGGKPHTASAN